MNDRWKLARELKSGDVISVVDPSGRARIRKVYKSVSTDIKHKASGEITDALIVCFEVMDGSARGLKQHDFAHPDSKVATA